MRAAIQYKVEHHCTYTTFISNSERRMVDVKKRSHSGDHMDGPEDIDLLVSKRLLELRVTLGLSQQQLAEMIGVTYQQAHKYEKGINRISAGRLASIARALDVPVGYFFGEIPATLLTESGQHDDLQPRISLKAAREFRKLAPEHQVAIYGLIRALTASKE